MPNPREATDRGVFINCPFDTQYKENLNTLCSLPFVMLGFFRELQWNRLILEMSVFRKSVN
jgi:hypothetical protein